MIKNRWLWLSLSTAALGFLCYFLSFVSDEQVKRQTEKELHKLEQKAGVYLDSVHFHLHNSPKRTFVNYLAATYKNTFSEEGIACFIYENDSLQYWTDNHAAVENYMLNVCLEKRLVKLKNGYYEVIRHPKNVFSPFQLYALVLVKSAFPYENRYLKNDFNRKLDLPEDLLFYENEKAGSIIINNHLSQPVFGMESRNDLRNPLFSVLSFCLFCLSVFLALLFLKGEQAVAWLTGMFVSVGLFWLLIFKMEVLFVSGLDESERSDLMVLVFIFVSTLLLLWLLAAIRKNTSVIKNISPVSSFLYPLGIYLFGLSINICLSRVFGRAYLSADLSDIMFSSSLGVYLSYLLIFVLLLSFVFFCGIALRQLENGNRLYQYYFIGFTIASVVVHHLMGQLDILTATWPGLLFGAFGVSRRLCANNKFLLGILMCLFISFLGAYLSIDQKNRIDYAQRMNLAKQLISPKDQIAENLFASVQSRMLKDPELLKMALKKDKTTGEIEQYVLKKYFTGYWDKYNISVCVFDSLCFPLVPHTQHLYNNNTYFDELIAQKLKPAESNLYFNEQLRDTTFYLYRTPLEKAHKPHLLYLVIESKKTPEYRGFPDLLLNQSALSTNTDYSYAVYKSGHIRNRQGIYEYPGFFSYPDDVQDSWLYQQKGYSHLIYKPDTNTRIIVSKSYNYFSDLFSTIGFLFLASSTFFLILSFVLSLKDQNEKSLSARIQRYAAVGIFALFIPVAISTIALVKNQTDKQNTDAIREKAQILGNYLSVNLADYDTLTNAHKDYVSYLLAKASGLFKSDLTLFYTNGEYYTTSLPKLFDEGLISKKLNPPVYSSLLNENESRDVVNESIGSLNFYSAYNLVKNKNGHTLCVVNLPYFSRQSELQARLFGYLSALLNIYILAFMIINVSLALLANWLTRPLQLLQEQFKQIGLNRQDHSIKYEKNDEIGVLISAYNNMLVQLKENAEKLARSEREGAWKEMARQVAHEVKNPLTPMKLSIQHVQRLMETDPGAATEHIKRISPILLEQIDALSHIATEFSNFWQLPAPKFEQIDLVSVIGSLLPLYNTDSGNEFKFQSNLQHAYVNADKDQLLRVLNNLVNNAVQALYESGTIVLSVAADGDKYIVSVTDNGKGIDEHVKSKIFQPNFSTKSYGTGLGLAMCKRIIEQNGGEIGFESEPGKGTRFYFSMRSSG